MRCRIRVYTYSQICIAGINCSVAKRLRFCNPPVTKADLKNLNPVTACKFQQTWSRRYDQAQSAELANNLKARMTPKGIHYRLYTVAASPNRNIPLNDVGQIASQGQREEHRGGAGFSASTSRPKAPTTTKTTAAAHKDFVKNLPSIIALPPRLKII